MAGRGAEQKESKPIHGIELGTWLQKKLENLSAAPDELHHACREAQDFASHFRVSYDIFLSIMKGPSPWFQYVPTTTVIVFIRQPSQNIHTFCRRFRSPYVIRSSSYPCWRDNRSGITVCNKHRVWFHITTCHIQVRCNLVGVQQSVLFEYCTFVYNILLKEKCCCTPAACTCWVLLLLLFSSKLWYNYRRSRHYHPEQEALAPVRPSSPVKRI